MEIRFNIKPRVIEGTSKQDVLRKAGLNGWVVDNSGSRYAGRSINDKTVKVINLEKHRKKVKVLKSGHRKITKRGHWIGYVYDFSKYADLIEVKQYRRNFSIEIKIR